MLFFEITLCEEKKTVNKAILFFSENKTVYR